MSVNVNKLRTLLREALELANLTPIHDDGYPGGTYHHISQALENIDPGSVESWSECGEWDLEIDSCYK